MNKNVFYAAARRLADYEAIESQIAAAQQRVAELEAALREIQRMTAVAVNLPLDGGDTGTIVNICTVASAALAGDAGEKD
jgi:prefoldin subunit 5